MTKIIIGVMGPGDGATKEICNQARELGQLIAQTGWVLLTGGRNAGVMDAAIRGAKEAGGLTIGILPTSTLDGASEPLDIPVLTGLGDARNTINVLSSAIVIACGMGPGTASEIALALKVGKRVILLDSGPTGQAFFQGLAPHPQQVFIASTPTDAVAIAWNIVATGTG